MYLRNALRNNRGSCCPIARSCFNRVTHLTVFQAAQCEFHVCVLWCEGFGMCHYSECVLYFNLSALITTHITPLFTSNSLFFPLHISFSHSLWCLPDLKDTFSLTNCSCYSCNGLYTSCWIESLYTQSTRSLTSASFGFLFFCFLSSSTALQLPPWRLCQTGPRRYVKSVWEGSVIGSVLCVVVQRGAGKVCWTDRDGWGMAPSSCRVYEAAERIEVQIGLEIRCRRTALGKEPWTISRRQVYKPESTWFH